jgi:HAD superfamily hydrolase (TIGR01509 family)
MPSGKTGIIGRLENNEEGIKYRIMSACQSAEKREEKIRLVIFDLDGTLIDTPRDVARTIADVVSAAVKSTPRIEDVLPLVGLPLEEILRRVLPKSEWDRLEHYVTAYRERYDRTVTPNTHLMPGAREVLELCHKRGLKLAIATGKLTRLAEAALDHCGVREYFAVVIGGDQGLRAKPDPEVGERILTSLNIGAAEALVVGDTIYDIGMGHACGARTCAVTFGVQSREELQAANPDYIISHFSELPAIIHLK